MPTDKKYVSAEQHEITAVCDLFHDRYNKPASRMIVFTLQQEMTYNKNKCLRSELYQVLELMGYTKRGKE